MWFMKRLYTDKWKGKRTTITIDPKRKEKIEKLLKHNETFGEFVRDAIDQDIWSKEDRKRSEMSSTEQYYKLKQVEQDVEKLRWNLDKLNTVVNGYREQDRRNEALSRRMTLAVDKIMSHRK